VTDDVDWPDVSAAVVTGHRDLIRALDRSLAWLETPSSRDAFPAGSPPITHEHARRSVAAFRALLLDDRAPADMAAALRARFDLYASRGADGAGRVLFTAYFAPEYAASRAPDDVYRHPLYAPPLGDASPGPTRRAIDDRGLLRGREIAWLRDPLDAYLAHVNGSARLRLPDGSTMLVGHDGTNERSYTSLGKLLIEEGLATPETISMQTIRAAHRRDPARVETLMRRNDRFVYFRVLEAGAWPLGSLGAPLTPESSIATDKRVFPPGGVVLVDTELVDATGRRTPYRRFMLDQDTGGAIETPGRADIFMGVGPEAGAVAGRMKSTGRLYYLFLKR
jgi:membrane-bound lytic murein transglycosylase A